MPGDLVPLLCSWCQAQLGLRYADTPPPYVYCRELCAANFERLNAKHLRREEQARRRRELSGS